MPVSPVTKSSYYLGLDVGKVRDPAAIAVMERRSVFTPGPFEPAGGAAGVTVTTYRIRHLERLPLGTAYPAVCDRVSAIADKIRLADVVVDCTGVGRPIFDLLADRGLHAAVHGDGRLGVRVVGVNFTSGAVASTNDGRIWNVPKRDLVAGLVLLFQNRELQIAERLADAQVLVQELVNFQETISAAGRVSFGNDGTNAKHDDYVSAAALCAWRARLRAPRELGAPNRLL